MDLHRAALHIHIPLHAIKDKELWLWAKVGSIT